MNDVELDDDISAHKQQYILALQWGCAVEIKFLLF